MNFTENTYKIIAANIRARRQQLNLTQELLAEKADVSADTVKNAETGRKSMQLDTYLRLVDALGTTPASMLVENPPQGYVERLVFMLGGRSEEEIQFALHIMEQTLKAQELYL